MAENNTSEFETEGGLSKAFLSVIDKQSVDNILNHIAATYEISQAKAYDEVVDKDAESLLDYLKEPVRSGAYVLMQRHGFK